MSFAPDARQVLSHLNYLGYTNINAHQLKEFMIDLKRFIKYDAQQQNIGKENQSYENDELQIPQARDVFEDLHQTETIASKAKKKSKTPGRNQNSIQYKQHLITVEINNSKQSHMDVEVPKIIIPQSEDDEYQTQYLYEVNGPTSLCSNCHSHQQLQAAHLNAASSASVCNTDVKAVPSTSKSLPVMPLSGSTTTTTVAASRKSGRPKSSTSSYIRPKVINKPSKCDPVTLYHQYKQEWDKIKFPGEHRHGETRWAVREKLLGDRS